MTLPLACCIGPRTGSSPLCSDSPAFVLARSPLGGRTGHSNLIGQGLSRGPQRPATRLTEVSIEALGGKPQAGGWRVHAADTGMDDVGGGRLGPGWVWLALAVGDGAGCRAMDCGRRGCGGRSQVAAGARPSSAEGCRPDLRPRRRPLSRWLPITAHLGAGVPDDGDRSLAPWHSRARDRRPSLYSNRYGTVPVFTPLMARVAEVAPLLLRLTALRIRRGQSLTIFVLDTPPVIVDAPVFQLLRRRAGETEHSRCHQKHEGGRSHQP